MSLISQVRNAMTGKLDRKGFWIRFTVHLIASIALTAAWVSLAEIWLDKRPLLVIVPLRLLLAGPQLFIYVRRLHDAGHSGKWVLCLLVLYAAGLLAFLHYGHRLDIVGKALAASRLHPPDESTADIQAIYDGDLETLLIVGSGAMTGMPGPLQMVFAGIIGALKSKKMPD
jgi:uncharacterized membrane protein YhaH (DUF805 family)